MENVSPREAGWLLVRAAVGDKETSGGREKKDNVPPVILYQKPD